MNRTATDRIMLVFVLVFTALMMTAFCACAETDVTPEKPRNGIPLIVIRIDESEEAIEGASAKDPKHTYGTIDEMNQSEEHSVRCVGEIQILVPDGFEGEYGSSEVPQGPITLKYIRGRGHMSWLLGVRKPYKVEFTEKVDLFGMGANKEWALMSNSTESTYLLNRITYWLGDQVGLPFQPQQIPVDVVMIGSVSGRQELGSYTLCETVKLGKGRISIPTMSKDTVTDDPEESSNITGGYLLSFYTESQDGDEPESNVFTTASGLEWINRSPEYESEDLTEGQSAQRQYIRSFMQETEDLILTPDPIGEAEHEAIGEKMDLRSAADYWWIQTFSVNLDGFTTSSTYLFKEPDPPLGSGKLVWGPLWDFDIGWAIDLGNEPSAPEGLINTPMIWFDTLRDKDPLFVQLLRERWEDPEDGICVKLEEITREGGLLDRYSEEIHDSWIAEKVQCFQEDPQEAETEFRTLIRYLRAWIDIRREWVSNNLDEVGKVYFTFTFIIDDEVVDVQRLRAYQYAGSLPDAPEREGYIFTGWKESQTGEDANGFQVDKDRVFIAEYLEPGLVTVPESIWFPEAEGWVASDEEIYTTDMKIYPEDAVVSRIQWTSSDPDVATGGLTPWIRGTGDTVITAELWNGLSRSYILHVYDPQATVLAEPEGVTSVSTLTLKVGETEQIYASLLPSGRPLAHNHYSLSFESADPGVAEIIEPFYGLVTGRDPGNTTVTITAYDMMDDSLPVWMTQCQITVLPE